MKLKLAVVCMLFVFSSCARYLFAQSIPAGQITKQITKSHPDAVGFRNTLDKELFKSNVSGGAADNILNALDNSKDMSSAISTAEAETNRLGDLTDRTEATNALTAATACTSTRNDAASYKFSPWFPTVGCSNNAINDFFNVSNQMAIANTVSYLYNPNQSTNQINSDLFTATFSQGFQAILSGTATQGSSQPSSTSTTTSSTDSVSTAVSKLEQGGDFNIRFPFPILFTKTKSSNSGVYMQTAPNIGFMVNGSSGQNTITQSTEYNINVPLEFYAETTSIEPQGSANSSNAQSGNVVMYLDVRPSVEVVSPAFASAIGLKSNRYFFLGQAAAGLSFYKGMRVGFQYYFGPSQVYQVPSTTGTTTKTGKVGGVHLVISFTPNKSKSSQ
jgi:hypothetical protein